MTRQIGPQGSAIASEFLVSPTAARGYFTTIAEAIAAATAPATILLKPGAYVENFTLPPGISLTGLPGDSDAPNVSITGKITFTGNGSTSISNIRLSTNGDYFLECTGANPCVLTIEDCYLDCADNTGINFTNSDANSSISILQCNGEAAVGFAFHTMSAAGLLTYFNFSGVGLSTTNSSNSAGQVNILYSSFSTPVACTGTGGVGIIGVNIDTSAQNVTPVTFSGTGANNSRQSTIDGGTATAVTIGTGVAAFLNVTIIGSSNANAISGAGSLSYADLIFAGSSSNISVSTQVPFVWKPYATAGNTSTAVRGTAGFDSTYFAVTDGLVTLSSPPSVQNWIIVTGTTQAMTANSYYVATNVAQTTFTLPTAAAAGTEIGIVGDTAAGWTLTFGTGQSVTIDNLSATVTTGSITSSEIGSAMIAVCTVANTTWRIYQSQTPLTVV